MKKILAIAAVMLAGCASEPPKPTGPTADHLQPIEAGYTWVYNSNGVRQTHRITGGQKVGRFDCKILEIHTGSVVQKKWLREDKDGLKIYRMEDDGRVINLPDPIVLIKFPAKVGDKWEFDEHQGPCTLSVTGTYEADETIKVPAGEFTAARIRLVKMLEGITEVETISWYSAGTGLVRLKGTDRIQGKPSTWSMDLESFKRN